MEGEDPDSPYEIGSSDLARAPAPKRKPPKPQSTRALEPQMKGKSGAVRVSGGGAVADQEGAGMPAAVVISVPEDDVFISPSLMLKERNVMPLEIDSLASAAVAGAFTPSNSRYGRQQTRMDLSSGDGGIELRQQSRIGQSIGGGVSRGNSVDVSARPDVEQVGEGGGGGEMPMTPLTFEREREVTFDLPPDSATPKSVSSERSDARTEISSAAVNPELSRSYHVRQLAYYAAKKYGDARLYDQHDATRIEREYREVLSKHGNSSAIRKLHRTIVSDVLDPSNTRLPTILLNGLCPLQLRGLFRLCGYKLTKNYWQKNIDDEITFYAFQILAFSILPIFPSLLSSIVSILSISWTMTQQSCMSYKKPAVVGSNFTFSDADLTPECPLAWSQVYDVTIPAGNYHTAQGIFTNPVILDEETASHCIGLATQISMINGYQIGLVCVYAAFISWSIFRLYLKLKQLRYMKIASHLKAVYVPQAYDLESKPWHQVLHILLQTNLPNLFPMALIAIFLYLQVCLARSEGVMPCLIINDPKLADAAAAAIMSTASSARRKCFAVCESMTTSFRTEYEQVTVSLLQVVIQTGIFGATAYALMDLLSKCYFFLDAEKFMDPAWEPPYKSVHEYRTRIMTMDMVDDYEILRKEMFIDTVKKQFPKLFDPVEVEAAPTPKYSRTSVLTDPPTAGDGA